MRNPDPGPKRYTSLAWAAAEGNEEMFEFLLDAGHDDDELSRVRPTTSPVYDSLTRQLFIGFREQHDPHSTCGPEATPGSIIRTFRP
jgi:ankyrin repeat protein